MTEQSITILCVDDEPNVLKALRRLLMDEVYVVLTAESGEEGLEKLEQEPVVQVVISDYRMPGMNGVDFLKQVYARWPDTVRIVLSGYADTAALVAAINEGQIYKFVPKPWHDDELRFTIANAVELYSLQQENCVLSKELQDANEELKIINQKLEKLVVERTQEIGFQNKALAHGHFILDSLPVGVIGLDCSDVVVKCNKKSVELLAGHATLRMGMAAKDCLPPSVQQMLASLPKEGDILQVEIEIGSHKVRLTGSSMKSREGQEGKILVLDAEYGQR